MNQLLSDISRRLDNVVSYGTIAEVDHDGGRVRVDVGGRLTGWLRVPGAIGQNFRAWTPLRVGTQVSLSSPSGDPANGVITQILYSQGLPPPATGGDIDVVVWNDGTRVAYDTAAQKLTVSTPGDITLECAGDMRLLAGGTLHIDAAAVRMFEGG
jgi:phage baseplate assembly protein V